MSGNNLSHSTLKRALPFVIIILASFFYVYEFMLRVMPSAMKMDLIKEFSIQATGFGIMGSLFYWSYNPMQIPAGLLYDRFSTRTIIAISMGLCGLGAIIFGIAPNFAILGLGRYMIGFSSAFAFIGVLMLSARWFHAKYFATITGIVQFMGSMGAVIGVYPIVKILNSHGWRSTQIVAGIIGVLIAILMYLIIRDHPEKPINVSSHQIINHKLTEKQRLKIVLRERQTWLTGLFAFFSWAPMDVFSSWWGINYISLYYNVDNAQAGKAIMFIWLGSAIASPIAGWWSNRINSRRTPLIACAVIAIVSSLVLLYVPDVSWNAMCVVLFFYGCASAAQTTTFGLVQDNMPPEVAGTAVGFNNMMVVMGGALLTPLVGILLDMVATHSAGVTPTYTLANYQSALVVIPLCGILGILVSLFFIKETKCQAQYSLNLH